MKVINPATEEVLAVLREDSKDSIEAKLGSLRLGQKEWAKVGLQKRLDCIVRFGNLISNNKEALSEILTSETAKPIQQSINEIAGAQNRIEHLIKHAKQWLGDEVMIESGTTHETIRYEPLGVIVNISAWNFPYNVGYNVFLYALVTGNAVLYKPSEYASMTGQAIEKYLHQAGVPKDVFHCVMGGAKVGQTLLEIDVDGYFFTGSHKIGQHIAQTVAHKLVPVQLELGGKDPLYVMNDVVDVKQEAINVAEGAFYNNGQSCCAVERIYVAEEIYDDFVTEFVNEVKSYIVGDPMDKTTFISALTRQPQLDVLANQVYDAITKGATLKIGGKSIEGKGYFFEPTILTDCNHDMLIMTEESFGPIIGIQKVSSEEEAIELMLDTEYGLSSAVFSKDRNKALSILDKMNTGTVYWNCCDRVSPNVPWSGRKNSGLGCTLSAQGIRAFVQPKAYHLRERV